MLYIRKNIYYKICNNLLRFMEKYIKLFEKIGIPEKTGNIYLDLLDHGTSSIAEICQRTNLHRPEVYRAIPFLKEEKLLRETIK